MLAPRRGGITHEPAAGVGRVQDQAGDALGVARGVHDREGPALRDTEEVELREPGGVDHGLQVPHPRLERDVLDIPIREAAAALVVPDHRVPLAQSLEPVPPQRAVPIELEMGEPGRGAHERRSGPWIA